MSEFCIIQSRPSSTDPVLHLRGCNMVDGHNCGFISPPRNLEDHTCTCRDGYMNDEGTLIPGSMIKEGYALAKPEYHAHKGCERCEVDPLKCDSRRQHLRPRDRKTTITTPPNGIFEFFVDGEGISEEVLYEFLQKNNDGDFTCLPDKRFKARSAVITQISWHR